MLGIVAGLAADAQGNVYISQRFNLPGYDRVRKLTLTSMPAPPNLLLPANQASDVIISPVLSWSPAAGAASYDLRFGTTNPPPFGLNTTNTSVPMGPLVYGATYYWQVSAKNSNASATSPVRSFTVLTVPTAPASPSPADWANSVSAPVLLTWSSVGATSYEVYFGTNPNALPKVATVASSTYQTPTLGLVTYYWRVVAVNPAGVMSSPIWRFTSAETVPVSGSRFVPVTPCRVVDTRAGQGKSGAFGPPTPNAGETREIPIPSGTCGIPGDAKAYSLNVTVVPHQPLGYVAMWPAGEPQPLVSTLNSFHGGVVANAAIVPAGRNGAISFFVTDRTDVILDINGYFGPSQGSGFIPLTPCRLLDTRAASGFAGVFGSPSLAAGDERSFSLPSSACAPPTNAAAYALNATVVPAGALGFLTVWPAGQGRPLASTLNSFDGSVVANAALVPAGTAGAISTFVTDRTDLIIDLSGYFASPGTAEGYGFIPVTPCRLLDTRLSHQSPLPAGSRLGAHFPGACGIPPTAKAYSMNVTAIPSGPLGFLTVYPNGQSIPFVSTLNSFQGRVVANAVIVSAGSGTGVYVTNETHVVLDVNGYFQ